MRKIKGKDTLTRVGAVAGLMQETSVNGLQDYGASLMQDSHVSVMQKV